MPHCILELSDNLLDADDAGEILTEINALLEGTQLFPPQEIVSRIVRLEEFQIAEGHPDDAIVHLTLHLLSGRSQEQLEKLGSELLSFLTMYFSESKEELHCHISVNICEMAKNTYFK